MSFRLKWAGDSCLNVYFEETIDPLVNDKTLSLKKEIRRADIQGVLGTISTYHSVGIFCNPRVINRAALMKQIEHLTETLSDDFNKTNEVVEIPVKYDGEDLSRVAKYSGLSELEVIKIHSSTLYRVYMLGFTPGFPYLGGLDVRIRTPRLKTPRVKVEAGSVGIADNQTGIYSMDSPGGWNIIGHTDLKLFDPTRTNPVLLKPGQHIKFTPTDVETEAQYVY